MIKFGYFGEKWHAPVCEIEEQVPTPVGESCMWCREPILDGEQGFVRRNLAYEEKPASNRFRFTATAVHRECDLRAIIGGIAHFEGRCTCCGGTADPDDGLGWRESARKILVLTEAGLRPKELRFKAAIEILSSDKKGVE